MRTVMVVAETGTILFHRSGPNRREVEETDKLQRGCGFPRPKFTETMMIDTVRQNVSFATTLRGAKVAEGS